MILELQHLRLVSVLRETGRLEAAARRLSLTPSALSHRIRNLEDRLGVPLFLRRTRPMRFTQAGQRLLNLADRVLPEVQAVEGDLDRLTAGEGGRLNIAIECHSCFEWLIPTMEAYRGDWPEVDIDLTAGWQQDPMPALLRGDLDLLVTPDVRFGEEAEFQALFHYPILLAVPPGHRLAERGRADPTDLAGETLITYPVARDRLDIFTRFLFPAGVEPAHHRTTELTAMVVQLVASGRGVAALPGWAMEEALARGTVVGVPIGESGLEGSLYLGLRRGEGEWPFVRAFLETARRESARVLQRIEPLAEAG